MFNVSMGYTFVVTRQGNTTSCGLKGNFQKLDVHNLFICHLSIPSFSTFSDKKKGELKLSPPLMSYEAGWIY